MLCVSPVGLGQPANVWLLLPSRSHISAVGLPHPSGALVLRKPHIPPWVLFSVCKRGMFIPKLLSGTENRCWVLETLRLALFTCCPAELCTAGSAKHDRNWFYLLLTIIFSWGHRLGSFGLLFSRFGFNYYLTSSLLVLFCTCCIVVILLWAVFWEKLGHTQWLLVDVMPGRWPSAVRSAPDWIMEAKNWKVMIVFQLKHGSTSHHFKVA